MAIALRPARTGDVDALAALYRSTFPDEDLVPLVTALGRLDPPVLAMIATDEADRVVGHGAISPCHVAPSGVAVGLLGPLAVAPAKQRQGLGRRLIAALLDAAGNAGMARICVLGDPNYYRRSGFTMEWSIRPPFDLPEDWVPAWQGRGLCTAQAPRGVLVCPKPWMNPTLWAD